MTIRFLTAGESHGKMLTAILEGIPAQLPVNIDAINEDLRRRQEGYGRGERSTRIEKDTVEIVAGVRFGKTTGAPICMLIHNKDWENRKKEMSLSAADFDEKYTITRPRPGHADFAGAMKYGTTDVKPILERASARSTATLVAIGAVCKQYCATFGITVLGYVRAIGDVDCGIRSVGDNTEEFRTRVQASPVRCPDSVASEAMMRAIDTAKTNGDTLGGIVCVEACNVPVGLGSHIQWDTRLDAQLAQALIAIPSAKGVFIGDDDIAHTPGSRAHDELFFEQGKFFRKTNHAGGIEAGISNGSNIRATVAFKPIPTLMKPLQSVDLKTKQPTSAAIERSDVCAVPSAVVVVEAMTAFVLAALHHEKFGGDAIKETQCNAGV